MATSTRKFLSRRDVVKLTRRGFTVGATTITGSTDGLLSKLLDGGPGTLRRLKKHGIR
jgi:hypothetical protein